VSLAAAPLHGESVAKRGTLPAPGTPEGSCTLTPLDGPLQPTTVPSACGHRTCCHAAMSSSTAAAGELSRQGNKDGGAASFRTDAALTRTGGGLSGLEKCGWQVVQEEEVVLELDETCLVPDVGPRVNGCDHRLQQQPAAASCTLMPASKAGPSAWGAHSEVGCSTVAEAGAAGAKQSGPCADMCGDLERLHFVKHLESAEDDGGLPVGEPLDSEDLPEGEPLDGSSGRSQGDDSDDLGVDVGESALIAASDDGCTGADGLLRDRDCASAASGQDRSERDLEGWQCNNDTANGGCVSAAADMRLLNDLQHVQRLRDSLLGNWDTHMTGMGTTCLFPNSKYADNMPS
jgi:hypothetical protein